MNRFRWRIVLILMLFATCGPARGDSLRVAVAANFRGTLEEIGRAFTEQTTWKLVLSSAATGVLVQQLISGAQFDVLFSADAKYIDVLRERGLVKSDTRISCARGRLVLWAPHLGRTPQLADLGNRSFRIGLANPTVAPYGSASREVLQHLGVWDPDSRRFVRGNSVASVMQLASNGLLDLALVGRSQLQRYGTGQRVGSTLAIDPGWHAELDQQAVVLQSTRQETAARALLDWMRGDAARAIIQRDGYALPAEDRAS